MVWKRCKIFVGTNHKSQLETGFEGWYLHNLIQFVSFFHWTMFKPLVPSPTGLCICLSSWKSVFIILTLLSGWPNYKHKKPAHPFTSFQKQQTSTQYFYGTLCSDSNTDQILQLNSAPLMTSFKYPVHLCGTDLFFLQCRNNFCCLALAL